LSSDQLFSTGFLSEDSRLEAAPEPDHAEPACKGANLLIIENVPVVSCPHCGESYLTAETLHELERIKLHRKNLAKPRNVAVAEYVRAQA